MTAGNAYKIGIIQMSMTKDVKANFARAEELLEQAAAEGVQVACLPAVPQRVFLSGRKAGIIRFSGADSRPVDRGTGEDR